MRILNVTILILLNYFFAAAQISITLDMVPNNTPMNADIHIAGTFNSWDSGSTDHILTKQQDGTYRIEITPPVGEVKFKFTRGSWASVESTAQGGFVPDRVFNYDGNATELNLQVLGWEDLSSGSGGNSTASSNVAILSDSFFIPQLNRYRKIWIYLPLDYYSSTKSYPVIYMQDGQNLFDIASSFSGEWKVDESLNQLADEGDYGAIVIGIDNGGAYRIEEYSPWIHPSYGGGQGEAYAEFIVATLKPYIDQNYRSLADRDHTGIMGSSLGGLISFYAAIEHQEVFGKAGILSPSFWFSEMAYQHVSQMGKQEDIKFYFVAGSSESEDMIPDMSRMRDSLLAVGFQSSSINFVQHDDGAHSEWYWAREFPDVYEWLCSNEIINSTISAQADYRIKVFPNPTKDSLRFEASLVQEIFGLDIYTMAGKKVLSKQLNLTDELDISSLTPGTYLVHIRHKEQVILTQQLVIK